MSKLDDKQRRRLRLLGVLALIFFTAHATFHATHGRPYDILWNCTLSNAILGIGLLCAQRHMVAIGLSWLAMGNLTWIADVLNGGEFFGTSTLTHFGGLTVGILGARIVGWPRYMWIWATVLLLALQQLCRWFTPPAANVNLAFSVYAGWEHRYASYRTFWLWMFFQAVLVYFLVDLIMSRLLRKKPAPAASQSNSPSQAAL